MKPRSFDLAPLLAAGLVAATSACHRSAPALRALPRFIDEETTVLFLGDSITQGGTYIAFIDAFLYTTYPGKKFEIVNLGLSSETASGLTENDHPFPRPCIHERIDRALAATEPGLTFICYGMNDGIYHPLSDERFAAYRDGMTRLVAKVKKAGSKVILLTPPPFDAETVRLRGKPLTPSGAGEYGYKSPYENYDEVLEAYGKWVLAQRDHVDLVIDVQTPLTKATAERRAVDPFWQSGDGIHPNAAGHYAMARAILAALEAPGAGNFPNLAALPSNDPRATPFQLIQQRRRLLSTSWREHVGHKRPGAKAAVPLEEARIQAAELDLRIRGLLAQHGGSCR